MFDDSIYKQKKRLSSLFLRAPDGNRTRTAVAGDRILSPACLPVPPPGQSVESRLFSFQVALHSHRFGSSRYSSGRVYQFHHRGNTLIKPVHITPGSNKKQKPAQTKNPNTRFGFSLERKTGLEPATPTLARSCSTK
jgi:hypothetical protein